MGTSVATLDRAYSLLHVKSVDTERRVLEGIATTPAPDRTDDVIDPLGVKFASTLPLLLHHDQKSPVGEVKFGRPTKDGIPFTAQLPKVTEPGIVRDRVDEAWHSAKYGLLRGASIGFRPLDEPKRRKTGGFHFTSIEVVELSLVSVPMNSEASITSIKSLDSAQLAALGTRSQVAVHARDKGSTTKRSAMNEHLSEQIAAARADLKTKSERFEELVQQDENTLTDKESQDLDALSVEVKALTKKIERLETLEEVQARQAKSVTYTTQTQTTKAATQTQTTTHRVEIKDAEPGIDLARVVICKVASFTGMMRGDFKSPADLARKWYPSAPRVHATLKAAVEPATTTDATWLGPLSEPSTVAADFVQFLRPQTILGQFGANGVPNLFQIPFNSRVLNETSGGSAYWVGQGKPKPLTKFDVTPASLGFAKVATISVISEESARFSNPSSETYVRGALARAIRARLDTDFIDPAKAAVAGESPASITNGVAALTPSGTDADSVRYDLSRLLGAFVGNNHDPANIVLIMPSTTALAVSLLTNGMGAPEFPELTMRGGRLRGIPVITSQYASLAGSPANNIVIAVDASEIYLSDDEQVTVDVSREASLEMDDSPTQDGSAGTGSSLVSLWQNNLIGLRAERFINWAKRRPEAVVYMDGVAWGVSAPTP